MLGSSPRRRNGCWELYLTTGKESRHPIPESRQKHRTGRPGRENSEEGLQCLPYGGFTLLELMVVLLIISVAGAVVVFGAGGGLENIRLRSDAKHLVAVIRHARDYAASHKLKVTVNVDKEGRKIIMITGGQKEGEDGAEGKEYSFSEGVNAKEAVSFAFSPSGGSSGGEVLIENRRGRSYRVKVDPFTGVPSLLDGENI